MFIESVHKELKSQTEGQHTRHRSCVNFQVNTLLPWSLIPVWKRNLHWNKGNYRNKTFSYQWYQWYVTSKIFIKLTLRACYFVETVKYHRDLLWIFGFSIIPNHTNFHTWHYFQNGCPISVHKGSWVVLNFAIFLLVLFCSCAFFIIFVDSWDIFRRVEMCMRACFWSWCSHCVCLPFC